MPIDIQRIKLRSITEDITLQCLQTLFYDCVSSLIGEHGA
jgi:hypothetical protein